MSLKVTLMVRTTKMKTIKTTRLGGHTDRSYMRAVREQSDCFALSELKYFPKVYLL